MFHIKSQNDLLYDDLRVHNIYKTSCFLALLNNLEIGAYALLPSNR